MSAERKVELTSSAWIFGPERLFWIAGTLNKERPANSQIRVELYPVVDKFPPLNQVPLIKNIRGIANNPEVFEDGRINIPKILWWQREHGPVNVERIHLPFHVDLPAAFYNFFVHSVFQEPGTWNDRKVAMGLAWLTKVASNRFAQDLARLLAIIQGEAAGLNVHMHIAENAGIRGKVDKLRGGSRYVWVENDVDRRRSRREHMLRARDPKRAVDAVEAYGYEGVILGIDHDFINGVDPREDISKYEEDFKKHLRAFHVSGSSGEHSLIGLTREEDKKFWAVMDLIKEKGLDNVVFCVDLNPFEMDKLSDNGQLEYVKDLVERLESF